MSDIDIQTIIEAMSYKTTKSLDQERLHVLLQ